jgi:hypothetical protein
MGSSTHRETLRRQRGARSDRELSMKSGRKLGSLENVKQT